MKNSGLLYIESIRKIFQSQKMLGDKTFLQLNEEQMHYSPDAETNSIAIQIQHLSGNMESRFSDFLTTDGEKPSRNRDAEFEEQRLSKAELLTSWNEGWQIVFTAIDSLADADLQKTVTIRQEPHSVLDAINRQLSHYAYHVGQIVQMGKLIKKAEWQTLSIPRNQSNVFNDKMMNKGASS